MSLKNRRIAAAAGLVVLVSLTAGIIVKDARAREGRMAMAQVQTEKGTAGSGQTRAGLPEGAQGGQSAEPGSRHGSVGGQPAGPGFQNRAVGGSLAGPGQTLSDSEESPGGAESAQGQSDGFPAEADTQARPSGETEVQEKRRHLPIVPRTSPCFLPETCIFSTMC